MLSCDEIREYRDKKNKYARYMGIITTELRPGYASGEMEIKQEYENAVDSLHGGVLFTIADTIGGAAAASRGMKMTTIDSSFHYLSPAFDAKMIFAEATEIKYGKTISVYELKVHDDKRRLLAYGTFSYYNLGVPLDLTK